MNFGQWMQLHRRSLLFVIAMLAGAGVFMGLQLPISLFPNVQFPRAVVTLDAGDRPAEQMAILVTRPVEEAVRRVPDVVDVQSTSTRGSAQISVNFSWGTDMARATLQIQSAIAEVLSSLPSGTQMSVKRMDPTVFPIIAYSLTSPHASLASLYDIAQYQLRPVLSSAAGVSRIGVTGGAEEEFEVGIDPVRLASYKLSVADVAKAVGSGNVLMATGRIEDHYKLFLVVAHTTITSLEDLKNIVVSSPGAAQVRLGDVAAVTQGTVPQWIRVTADGRDAVLLNVYQQPGANSVAIAKEIRTKLDAFSPRLPPGVHISNWYDQSVLVTDSASSVRDAILIGVVLAAITLFVFLRNWKITLIAVTLVPVVMAATILLLKVFNMGFNIMTLGGMAAAVGLIIDDAITMVEHIVRRMREAGEKNFHGRVMHAALEFTRPLAGSSAATLIIFLPLAFLSGVTGAFFKALSITMASALLISFFVTWLAIPILCDRLLKPADANEDDGSKVSNWITARYSAANRGVARRPWLALVGLAPFVAVAVFSFMQVGSGFMPSMDEGGFILDYQTAPGTSVTETDRLMRQIEAIITANPNVATYSRRTGLGLGGDLGEPNKGDFFVKLKTSGREPIDKVMDEVRTQVETTVPGVQVEFAQLMEDLIGDLTAVPQPVQVKIFSDDQQTLDDTARKVAAAIGKIQGIVDIKNGINPAGDALELRIDPEAAAAEGSDAQSVAQAVSDMVAGNVATQFESHSKTLGVRIRVNDAIALNETQLGDLQIRAADGHLFPLHRVAKLVKVTGQPEISRDNLKRMVAVTARISGRDLGSTIVDVQHALSAKGLLPSTVYYELGGLYQQQQIAFHGLLTVFAAAVALVFALLLFLYERFRVAAAVMLMPLLAVGAVFIGLWLTGIELNISAMMGMTMILGIVTEVAIMYVSEFQMLVNEEEVGIHQALLDAGVNRLRPIAMTTIAAILALLPLAFAFGRGSAMQQPLAIAIISGLLVQLPLVLLVLPVLLKLLLKNNAQKV